jgi:hypothetical protein
MAIQPMYDLSQAQAMTASSSATQSEFTQHIITPPTTGTGFEFDPMAASFANMSFPQNQNGIPGSPFDFVGPLVSGAKCELECVADSRTSPYSTLLG